MKVVFASGALAKFLDARERGASRRELLELQIAAMQGPPAGAKQRKEKRGENAAAKEPEQQTERARLEREWSGVTQI